MIGAGFEHGYERERRPGLVEWLWVVEYSVGRRKG